jgi:hypothetical protein
MAKMSENLRVANHNQTREKKRIAVQKHQEKLIMKREQRDKKSKELGYESYDDQKKQSSLLAKNWWLQQGNYKNSEGNPMPFESYEEFKKTTGKKLAYRFTTKTIAVIV